MRQHVIGAGFERVPERAVLGTGCRYDNGPIGTLFRRPVDEVGSTVVDLAARDNNHIAPLLEEPLPPLLQFVAVADDVERRVRRERRLDVVAVAFVRERDECTDCVAHTGSVSYGFGGSLRRSLAEMTGGFAVVVATVGRRTSQIFACCEAKMSSPDSCGVARNVTLPPFVLMTYMSWSTSRTTGFETPLALCAVQATQTSTWSPARIWPPTSAALSSGIKTARWFLASVCVSTLPVRGTKY